MNHILQNTWSSTPTFDFLKVALDTSKASVLDAVRQYFPTCDIMSGTWALHKNASGYLQGEEVSVHGERLFIVYNYPSRSTDTFIVAVGSMANVLDLFLVVNFDKGRRSSAEGIPSIDAYTQIRLHRLLEAHVCVDTVRHEYTDIVGLMRSINSASQHRKASEIELGDIYAGRTYYFGVPSNRISKTYLYEKGKKHNIYGMLRWLRLETQIVAAKTEDQYSLYHEPPLSVAKHQHIFTSTWPYI